MKKRSKVPRTLAAAGALFGLVVAGLAAISPSSAAPAETAIQYRVLVFTEDVEAPQTVAGVAAIRALGRTHQFSVQVTDEPEKFEPHQLDKFRAVIFLNSDGAVERKIATPWHGSPTRSASLSKPAGSSMSSPT